MTQQHPSHSLKIAMLGPFGLHPNKTMRSRALSLAREHVKRGHRVQIIMPPWQTPEEAGRVWQEDGVELVYVALGGGLPFIVGRMLGAVGRFGPDVVHAFKPKAYSGLAMWCLWQMGRLFGGKRRPLLVTDTDDWEGAGGWNDRADYTAVQKRFFAWQERWGLTHCDLLTVASRALQTLAWGHGTPSDRLLYLPNGAGIKRPLSAERARLRQEKREGLGLGERPTLLLYSRLFEFDIGRLIAILQQVVQAIPDVVVLAVGAGLYEDDAAQFRDELAKAHLLEHVVDTGWLDEAVLPATLLAADVGLYLMEDDLLNRTKCPVKLADMLHVGVPVVAEDVGQVGEYVVSGRTGLLRPSGDLAGVAADLVRLLRDEGLRQEILGAGQDHVDRSFSWAGHAELLEGFYAP